MGELAPISLAGLGVWTDESESQISLDHARRYASATNDKDPLNRSGGFLPPLFAALVTRQALHTATSNVLPPRFAQTAFMVHGEHDLHITDPLRVGMTVRTRGQPLGVRVSTAGTAVLFKLETRDHEGAILSTQFHTSFLPGLTEGVSAGNDAPDHRMPKDLALREPEITSTVKVDDDQTYRYADASGDHTPIHVDDAFALSRGLPGIIVHGLCTMAVVTRSLIEVLADGDDLRLTRIAVRFSRNVLPGQTLSIRIWSGNGRGKGEYRFETLNDKGDRVLTHGMVCFSL